MTAMEKRMIAHFNDCIISNKYNYLEDENDKKDWI